MHGDEDWVPARVTSPLFHGCFDWHSAVHSHWALARLRPSALDGVFTPERVEAEVRFLERHPSFELPYGVAWLLLLCAEVRDPVLEPLRALGVERLSRWLEKLPCPIRSGEHTQTAFAMGLAYDASPPLQGLIADRARSFYLADRDGPIRYEPSAHDFLSPCLAEADLVRRVLGREFVPWFRAFLPAIDLQPVVTVDRGEGKLAHFDGLNLSRAWMLRSLGYAVGDLHLVALAEAHAAEGMKGLWTDRYEVTHWLGTFATYWLAGG